MQQAIEQLLQYLRGIWHRRWLGLAVAWLVAVAGVVHVFRLPDLYEASARVYVDTQSLLRPLLAGMTVIPDAGQQVGILSRLLMTRPNIAKIIRKSDLDTSMQQSADSLIDATMGSLSISRAGGDNIYTIAFRWGDGRKARDVVQAALSTFIEQSMGGNRADAEVARRFLDQQIAEYEQRLAEAEGRVQAFRLKYLGLVGAGVGTFLSQMAAVSEQIKEARIEVRIAEQTRDGIKAQLAGQLDDEADASPAPDLPITVPEIDGRIDALKRQVDDLLRKYTDAHPDVVYSRRLIAQLEEERSRELAARRQAAAARPRSAVVASTAVGQQLKVALNEAEASLNSKRARLAEYEATYARLKSTAEGQPRIETELGQLNRDYSIQKRQYEQLVQRRETASLSGKVEDAGGAEFRIIEPPRLRPGPVAPNRFNLLGGVLVVSLLAGIGASFVLSQVRPTFHDGRALGETVQRPLLGMVSTVPSSTLTRKRWREGLLFAVGLGGLLVWCGAAILRARGYF